MTDREVIVVDKSILSQYIDACEIIKDTEKEISLLKKKRKTIIQTNVKGSNPDFPYQEQHFKIQGTAFTYGDDSHLRFEENLLKQQQENAERLKMDVEQWMLTITMRMQRIVRYKFFDKNSWGEVADRIGGKATADSVRKEFENFMKAA